MDALTPSTNAVYDYARFPMWLIDDIAIQNTEIVINGWALPDHGDHTLGVISLNGQVPVRYDVSHSPAIAKTFPLMPGSDRARFKATFSLSAAGDGNLHLSYVGARTREAFNPWQDAYFPLQLWRDRTIKEPSGFQMRRTQGSESYFKYVLYGYTVARTLDKLTRTYFGRPLNSFSSILDWGCGSGRVLQQIHEMAPHSKLCGSDIDADNIGWCQQNIPYAKFQVAQLLPPTDFPSKSFDLIFGISVFTHLKRDAFEAWRDELYRLLPPRGVALVTICRWTQAFRSGNMNVVNTLAETGFDDTTPDHALDTTISDPTYYRGTFVNTKTVKEIFEKKFVVRDIVPQANGSSQDHIVLEKAR